ncbi:MAG: phosphoenolpyruvate carboxylase [Candidatus Eremiobacterota bacterium]
MPAVMDNEKLRQEIRWLGQQLGRVIRAVEGPEMLALEEEIRGLSKARRAGDPQAHAELTRAVRGLSMPEAWAIVRAFSFFFGLANLAEDRHRARVLRERERLEYPAPRRESIRAAVQALREAGWSASRVQKLLDALVIEPVFTAHPTEAKRRTIRRKLRCIRERMQELDSNDLLEPERRRLERSILTELLTLWQSDPVQDRRPTVLEEVERGLYFQNTLWSVIPHLFDDLRRALTEFYPGYPFRLERPPLHFGSWIGGDRDGNPHVTCEVTARTLAVLRVESLRRHLDRSRQMLQIFSHSDYRIRPDTGLLEAVREARGRWPDLDAQLSPVSEREPYRLWLGMLRWRLQRALERPPWEDPPEGAYRRAVELESDLQRLERSLAGHRPRFDPELSNESPELTAWLDQVRVFGFHLHRLDVRQESGRYREVLDEVFCLGYGVKGFGRLSPEHRLKVLLDTLGKPPDRPLDDGLSDLARDTLKLFGTLRDAWQRFGPEALGGHVISMTHHPADLLAAVWLEEWAGGGLCLPTIPLFETIDDLERCTDILRDTMAVEAYRRRLGEGGRQIVMVGYSDSCKDGGYLAASWAQYKAQARLHQEAERLGINLTLFHGRGGALGRGGGPAARSILTLPPGTATGGLRLTEQGEVLAERYDDPPIAYRHLEQVLWGMLMISARPPDEPRAEWVEAMERFSARSMLTYRELVDQPGFLEYFSKATPIDEIEALPLGSRPARRRGRCTLGDLRAIPWVFAWTQARVLLPAWYGVGAALDRPEDLPLLREMYRSWPFFRGTMDNCALALAKADPGIAHLYAELVADEEVRRNIWDRLSGELVAARRAVLAVTEQNELLDDVSWLKHSIRIRNPYVDPLNFLQVELYRRLETASAPEAAEIHALLRLTIQGIASGLRTTG